MASVRGFCAASAALVDDEEAAVAALADEEGRRDLGFELGRVEVDVEDHARLGGGLAAEALDELLRGRTRGGGEDDVEDEGVEGQHAAGILIEDGASGWKMRPPRLPKKSPAFA